MGRLTGLSARLRQLLHRSAAEERMREEIRFHLEMETEKNLRAGMPPAEARRRAVLAFGGAEGHKEALRAGRGMPLLENVARDVRHAARSLRRAPGFTLVAVATLALGIGASTVVFSVVDGVVLNPFPYPEPDRLVGIGPAFPRLGQPVSYWEVLSPAEYEDIRDGTRTLEREVAWDMGNRQVTIGDATENVFTALWWGDAFATLGVQPALGRGFLPEEIEQGERVAVVSNRLWKSRFGAD
ncbi:MAG TPA: permease prefix domain 1-containing protein, partial [Armatimonadota bacterium]|nr:permease prefix domain 1-containing protein [Armatimonadota bacterium]